MDSGFDVYPAEGVFTTIVPKTRMLGKHGVLPERFDLSSTLSDVKEQGKWDSCTAFACCAALERLPYEGPNHQDESESFIWYNAKAVEIKLRGGNDDPAKDRATSLSAAIMAVQEFGSCREIACPYDASQPSSLAKPSEDAYEEALWKKGITAYQIDPGTTHKSKKQSLYLRDAINQVLFLTHRPVIISFPITQAALEAAGRNSEGALSVRGSLRRREVATSHAVVIVGYDEATNMFKFKNSHGPKWGHGGYGHMPFKYLEYIGNTFVLYDQCDYVPERASGLAASSPQDVLLAPAGDHR